MLHVACTPFTVLYLCTVTSQEHDVSVEGLQLREPQFPQRQYASILDLSFGASGQLMPAEAAAGPSLTLRRFGLDNPSGGLDLALRVPHMGNGVFGEDFPDLEGGVLGGPGDFTLADLVRANRLRTFNDGEAATAANAVAQMAGAGDGPARGAATAGQLATPADPAAAAAGADPTTGADPVVGADPTVTAGQLATLADPAAAAAGADPTTGAGPVVGADPTATGAVAGQATADMAATTAAAVAPRGGNAQRGAQDANAPSNKGRTTGAKADGEPRTIRALVRKAVEDDFDGVADRELYRTVITVEERDATAALTPDELRDGLAEEREQERAREVARRNRPGFNDLEEQEVREGMGYPEHIPHVCMWCLGFITDPSKLHRDHIVARKKGGPTLKENLCFMHADCNQKAKGTQALMFAPWLRVLVRAASREREYSHLIKQQNKNAPGKPGRPTQAELRFSKDLPLILGFRAFQEASAEQALADARAVLGGPSGIGGIERDTTGRARGRTKPASKERRRIYTAEERTSALERVRAMRRAKEARLSGGPAPADSLGLDEERATAADEERATAAKRSKPASKKRRRVYTAEERASALERLMAEAAEAEAAEAEAAEAEAARAARAEPAAAEAEAAEAEAMEAEAAEAEAAEAEAAEAEADAEEAEAEVEAASGNTPDRAGNVSNNDNELDWWW